MVTSRGRGGARLLAVLCSSALVVAAPAASGVVVHVSSYGRRFEKIRVTMSSFLDQTLMPRLAYFSHACRSAERSQRIGCDWQDFDSPEWRHLCGRNCSDAGRAQFPFASLGRAREIAYTADDRGPTMRVLALRGPAIVGDVSSRDLVVVADDDKVYPPDLLEKLSANAPRGTRRAVGCRGWSYRRGDPELDELRHSVYGYATMRYENRGELLGNASSKRVHVLAGSDAYAFTWDDCIPDAIERAIDRFALSKQESFFDDVIISYALAECGYELRVVRCGDEPINREDLFGDYELTPQGRSSTIDSRDALNIGVYRKLFHRNRPRVNVQ